MNPADVWEAAAQAEAGQLTPHDTVFVRLRARPPVWPDDSVTAAWLAGITAARQAADRALDPWADADEPVIVEGWELPPE